MRSTTVAVGRVLALLSAFLVISVVAGVLFAGLFLPAVGATGTITRGTVDWFYNDVDPTLKEPPLSQGSTMYAADGKTVIARFYEENRVLTSLNRIAPVMQNAIIAIEDSRFYEEGGVDPKGLFRAFVANLLNDGSVQGASTLTQQYIKNVLLETAVVAGDKQAAEEAVARDNARKIREIRMAIQLAKTRPKKVILEGYLNIANFGRNNYGVEAAAQYYFQTTAAKLTLPQAALLAGIVQKPEGYNPFNTKYRKAALDRRNTVLERMFELKMISEAEMTAAKATALPTKAQPALSGCVTAQGFSGYFCQYALASLLSDPRYEKLGKTSSERENAVKRGGLKIYTTLDYGLQQAATDAVMKKIPPKDSSQVALSAVTVEPGTGHVLSIAQNRYFSNEEGKPGEITGKTEVNWGVDKQYGGSAGFQTGSSFKPFTLATWLAKGKGLGDTVDADVIDHPFSDFTACGSALRGGKYKPENSEPSERGTMDVLTATRLSVNTAYVDMQSKLDLCDIAKTAESLGVHAASTPSSDQITCWAGEYQSAPMAHLPTQCPSLTLGVVNISPMTMANAYATFAADGIYCTPTAITGVKDRNGKDVQIGGASCNQSISPEVARGVTYALKRIIPSGTARNISPVPWPAAGKTGTTDEAKYGTWFVGYTKQRSTAVVTVDPNPGPKGPRSLDGRVIGGVQMPRHVFGATISAPVWKSIMLKAMDGLPDEDWQNPPQKMIEGSGIRIADVTGRSIDEATAILEDQGFKVRVGRPVPSSVGPDTVAKQSPSGGRVSPGSKVTIYPGDGSQQGEDQGGNGGGNNGGGNGNGGNGGNGNGGNGNGGNGNG